MPIGLPNTIDWAQLTLEERRLEADRSYREVAEEWQIAIDQAIANYPRIYLQLARGHDKTERFAWWSLLWLNSTRANRGYACGVDRDNAKLFRDASKKIVSLHPELFEKIEVEKHVVYSKDTGSYIETISSDANSAYGLNFELLICNDFHAWPDKSFWEILWTACEKKPDVRIWMESNALTLGQEGTVWIDKFRGWIKEHSVNGWKQFEDTLNSGIAPTVDHGQKWWNFIPTRFLANWQSAQDQLTVWRDTLHPSTYKRLIDNQDCSDQDSFLTQEQVEAVEVLKGPSLKSEGEVGKRGKIITGIDIGIKKDATAIATVQLIPVLKGNSPRLTLLDLEVLTGSIEDPVLLERVESIALAHRKKFGSTIVADPWNAQAMLQKHRGIMEEWIFTAARLQALTQHLYRVIADRQLSLYPNAGYAFQAGKDWDLKKELINAVMKPTSYGQRVDHRSGGYSDRLIAVGMCCHKLLEDGMSNIFLPPKKSEQPDHLVGSSIIESICGKDKKSKYLVI